MTITCSVTTYLVGVYLFQDGVDVLRQEPFFLLEGSTELVDRDEPEVTQISENT